MDKVIVVGVGVAVAIGTALYYLLTREKEEPMRRRSGTGNRHSTERPRSPPIAYSEVKPKRLIKRKSVSVSKRSNTQEDASEFSRTSEPDKESGENSQMQGTRSPMLLDIQNDTQTSPGIADNSSPDEESGENSQRCGSISPVPLETQEISDANFSISAVCPACYEPANVTLHPCKHRVFCREHAEYYFDLAKRFKHVPKCPNLDCRQVLEYFTG